MDRDLNDMAVQEYSQRCESKKSFLLRVLKLHKGVLIWEKLIVRPKKVRNRIVSEDHLQLRLDAVIFSP